MGGMNRSETSHGRRRVANWPTGVRQIVSGGQTGVDRAALDVALELGLPHGGWCPRHRRAEDGRIPARYQLRECESVEYWVRTERNVVDSDATLILYFGVLTGGSRFTFRMARKHARQCQCVDLGPCGMPAVGPLQAWLREEEVQTLNVAGPRASVSPGIYEAATAYLRSLLARDTTTRTR